MPEAPSRPVPLSALFSAFLNVSLWGFGGGLAWARRIVVEQRGWMGDLEFAEVLTLCQLMPGPNVVGIATCVGTKLRGTLGAIAAVAGFIVVPWTIGLAIGSVVLRHAETAMLRSILGGLSAAAAGLLIGTGLRLLMPHRRRWPRLLVAGLAFGGMAFARLPLPVVLLVLAPIGVAAARAERA